MTMEQLVAFNDKLIGLPSGVIVFLTCIVIGYGVKMSRRLSNDWLPSAIMFVGITLFMLIAPTRSKDVEMRIWLTRNFCFGLIIGGAAWSTHRFFIRWLERKFGFGDYLSNRPIHRNGKPESEWDPDGTRDECK